MGGGGGGGGVTERERERERESRPNLDGANTRGLRDTLENYVSRRSGLKGFELY